MKKIYASKEERWAAYKEKYRFAGKKPDLEHMIEKCKELSIKKWYPEYYQQVISWIDKDIPFREKLYLFRNQIKKIPVCKTCGKPVKFKYGNLGYEQYCCQACSNRSETTKQKREQTCLERFGTTAPAGCEEVKAKTRATNLKKYGVEHPSQNKEWYDKTVQTRIEKYGGVGNASKSSKEKYERTCLVKYGAKNPLASKEFRDEHNMVSPFKDPAIQQKIEQTNLKRYGKKRYNNPEKIAKTMMERYGYVSNFSAPGSKEKADQTRLERYGNPKYNNSKKRKETLIERYGHDSPLYVPEYSEKRYATMKKNGTFCKSSIEEQFEQYLIDKNIKYEKQYKSELYPWRCDFYIPDKDLYVEIQGSWVHGGHPFIEETDKKILNIWKEKSKKSKYFQKAIYIWTESDVVKRNTAKQNNLRYLEIFTIKIDKVIEEYERFVSGL